MRRFHSIRYFLLALLLAIVPVSSAHAGVFISVGIAPPPLPVYVQPPCPEPNMMWAPGYWAYDYDNGGYYWVPGAWVPAPYEGAMWTPPYWGWNDGFYMFHAGYWGPEVGYYGGVNYGFGYMGVGFAGGEWHEHHFFYNTAIINVDHTYIHNTYINDTIVRDHTVVNYNHIAYSGGPHGIQHMPTPEERNAMQMPHTAPTRFQDQHMVEARSNRQSFFIANHGRPQTVALSRPLPAEHVQPPNPGDARRGLPLTGGLSGSARESTSRPVQPLSGMQNRPQNNMQPNLRQNENARISAAPVNQQPQRGFGNMQPQPVQRPLSNTPQPIQQRTVQPQTMQQQRSLNENQPIANRPQSQQLYRPNMQQPQRPSFESRPAPQPQPQFRPQPQQQSRPQAQLPQAQPRFDSQSRVQPIPSYRPAAPQPQSRPQPQPQFRAQPQPQSRPQPQPQFRAQPQQQYRPQPQRAPESRPAPQPKSDSRPHR
jgi:WXXGXW repeat (2 copies)